ncbi:MAG: hypothetical protein LBS25_06600 [Candidatus Symbiothrix sp.]|jgi:hypothetical protein|nr:hypothetical protein [Candidatus Symbiothrix sp.]
MKHIIQQPVKIFTVIFSLLKCFEISAVDEFLQTDARSLALGRVRALSEELVNPANLSFSSEKEIGLTVFNHFEMSELNTATLYWKCPNSKIDFGTKFVTFGYSDYRISSWQGFLSKKIFSNLAIGIQLETIMQSSILEEDSRYFLSSGIGISYRLNERFDLSVLGENVLTTYETKPWRWMAGIRYHLSNEAVVLMETATGKIVPFAFSVGLEYAFSESFFLRSGYDSQGKAPSFGIGYQWNKWKIDVGFSLHQVLGISSGASVSYEL